MKDGMKKKEDNSDQLRKRGSQILAQDILEKRMH